MGICMMRAACHDTSGSEAIPSLKQVAHIPLFPLGFRFVETEYGLLLWTPTPCSLSEVRVGCVWSGLIWV
jgi:hypothetical protein